MSIEVRNSSSGIVLLMVIDERESLALIGDLILCQKDTGDISEGFEQLLQILLLSVLRQIRHTNGCCVFG